jgi:hypothetical protein
MQRFWWFPGAPGIVGPGHHMLEYLNSPGDTSRFRCGKDLAGVKKVSCGSKLFHSKLFIKRSLPACLAPEGSLVAGGWQVRMHDVNYVIHRKTTGMFEWLTDTEKDGVIEATCSWTKSISGILSKGIKGICWRISNDHECQREPMGVRESPNSWTYKWEHGKGKLVPPVQRC